MEDHIEKALRDAEPMLALVKDPDLVYPLEKPTIARLPRELLEIILDLIGYREDMCHVSLVCREWRAVMARLMWATFTTDFQPCGPQDLDALLALRFGILPHVRRLVVQQPRDLVLTNDCPKSILKNMQRNSLKELINFNSMNLMDLKDVLVSQSGLQRIYGYIIPDPTDLQQCDWMWPYLSGIRIYTVILKEHTLARELKMQQSLLRGMSMLEQLHVCYDTYRSPDIIQEAFADISLMLTNELRLSRLKSILLWRIDMQQSSQLLFDRIDVSRLCTLRIVECIGVEPFLDRMADWYNDNSGSLEAFGFTFTKKWWVSNQNSTRYSVERFLLICPSLSFLCFDFCETPLLRTDCIIRHGKTLQKLHFSAYSWPAEPETSVQVYSVQDLEAILEACQRLIRISVDIPWGLVDLGSVDQQSCEYELTRCEGDQLLVLREFESMLAMIAKHPNIRTLRFLNLPKIQYSSSVEVHDYVTPLIEDDARRCQGLMGKFANEVFRFLAGRNSNVQILEVLPTLQPPTANKRDGNGHQWPNYAYEAHKTNHQGRTICWMRPCKTVDWVRKWK